jgi:hypothetical protein
LLSSPGEPHALSISSSLISSAGYLVKGAKSWRSSPCTFLQLPATSPSYVVMSSSASHSGTKFHLSTISIHGPDVLRWTSKYYTLMYRYIVQHFCRSNTTVAAYNWLFKKT